MSDHAAVTLPMFVLLILALTPPFPDFGLKETVILNSGQRLPVACRASLFSFASLVGTETSRLCIQRLLFLS